MNSAKTHIWDVKNSCQGRDLLMSVNERVIAPIREDFIFTKRFAKINPRENFRIYSTNSGKHNYETQYLVFKVYQGIRCWHRQSTALHAGNNLRLFRIKIHIKEIYQKKSEAVFHRLVNNSSTKPDNPKAMSIKEGSEVNFELIVIFLWHIS